MSEYEESIKQMETVASEIYIEYNQLCKLVNKINDQLDRMERLILLIKSDLLGTTKIDTNN